MFARRRTASADEAGVKGACPLARRACQSGSQQRAVRWADTLRDLRMTWRAEAIGRLQREHFDLLVVGGGITGAGIALEATLRGYKGRAGRGERLCIGNESQVDQAGARRAALPDPGRDGVRPRGPRRAYLPARARPRVGQAAAVPGAAAGATRTLWSVSMGCSPCTSVWATRGRSQVVAT